MLGTNLDSTSLRELIEIAAHGLRPARPFGPFDDGAWRRTLTGVSQHRLAGLLLERLKEPSSAVEASQRDQARAASRLASVRSLQLEQLLAESIASLDAARVDVRVLKGAAHARCLYPRPELRPYSDVDLLVRGPQWAQAVDVLMSAGCVRQHPEVSHGFDARFGKGATFRTPTGIGIDLHRTLVAGYFGMRIDLDSLFERPQAMSVGGMSCLALSPEAQLLHAAVHATLSDYEPKLISVRDVLNASMVDGLDVNEALDLASRWGATAVLARALNEARKTLEPAVSNELLEWSRSHSTSFRNRALLSAYDVRRGRWAWQSASGLFAVHGTRARLIYAVAVTAPLRRQLRSSLPRRRDDDPRPA
jgi:hypothetical protein